jgi:DNA polymerase elongation subunit (family B)
LAACFLAGRFPPFFRTYPSISARDKLRDAGIPVHPGESAGYVIADAKAKDKARRVTIGGEGEELRYDAKEYVKRLRDVTKRRLHFNVIHSTQTLARSRWSLSLY